MAYGRYHPFFLAKDYQRGVVEAGKCQLDGPGDYIPLFRGVNFSSIGFRTCARSHVNGTLVETMSEIEYNTFLMLELDRTVTRICEQCAIDPAITHEEAEKLGFKHPAVDGEPIIMSSDFVVEHCTEGVRSRRVISCKRREDYDNKTRVAEKALIEAMAWKRRDIPFSVQFDVDIPATLVANAKLVLPRHPVSQLPCDTDEVAIIAAWLSSHLALQRLPLATVCKWCDRAGFLPEGTSLAVALHLTARRHWPVDMNRPIAGHLPLPLLPSKSKN